MKLKFAWLKSTSNLRGSSNTFAMFVNDSRPKSVSVCLSRYPTTGGSPFSTAALQPAASVSPGGGHHVVAGCTIVPDPDNESDLTTAKKGRTTVLTLCVY
jgi:hypothetical protein